ncbi:tripartite tricarboxylate transporter permease [Microvirga antarctica]|uniref:tripartite tricarboxylate transporter permease n=1 Tax=Microvirga antarctica TaxID=2819233 RepID=UPI001B30C840|nr:tripartite tricarboxylate transporter permease [Microvirga antarctica]
MDTFSGLLHGFSVAFQPANLFWCFVGCFLGTIVGILPGLGPAATIAMLLPLTFQMDPSGGIIMLCGIYYGAKYGGSTTSILLNMPGEASSVVSCLDGYQMARKGRAGAALGIAAIASFIAGTVGVVALTVVAPPIAAFALSFSSPEYFALMCLGLSLVVLLTGPSLVKGLLSLLIGLWLASIGTDLFTAQSRFTFGRSELLGGIEFMIVAIGVFALSEVLASIENREQTRLLPVPRGLRNLLPSWEELKACRFAFLNGSVVGFIVGVLPGAGSAIASFISYGVEKAVSRHPEKFGTGVPEGLAAPEGANNADTGGALVPLLTLGIPGGGTTAILLSALVFWGIKPGPLMITESPDIFWGLVASMYIGNVVLLILNLPLVPLFAQILRIPVYVLFPLIFGIAIVGAYSTSGQIFDVALLAIFGLLGYLMVKFGFPTAPLILGFVLGDPMERALRQSLMMSQGDFLPMLSRPLAAGMLCLAVLILLVPFLGQINRWRVRAITETV